MTRFRPLQGCLMQASKSTSLPNPRSLNNGKSAKMITEGVEQVNANGKMSHPSERTRILELVSQRTGEQMVWTSLTEDGLPSGYQNSDGIRLFDPSVIATRARVWQ